MAKVDKGPGSSQDAISKCLQHVVQEEQNI